MKDMVVSLRELLDPDVISGEEALRIADQRSAQRESFGTEVARFVGQYLMAPRILAASVERGFALLEVAAQPAQYFWIVRTALAHEDAFVRAAATAVVARQARKAGWIGKLAADSEPRVRAGMMEALWRQTGPEVEDALLAAAQDTNETVAANAAYGLYLLDAGRYFETVQKLTAHPIPAFRCAAAGLVAKIEPAVRGQLLKPLLTDTDASVRRAAFQTLTAIKNGAQTTPRAA